MSERDIERFYKVLSKVIDAQEFKAFDHDIIYASWTVVVLSEVGVVGLNDHFKDPKNPTNSELALWDIEYGVPFSEVQKSARIDAGIVESMPKIVH